MSAEEPDVKIQFPKKKQEKLLTGANLSFSTSSHKQLSKPAKPNIKKTKNQPSYQMPSALYPRSSNVK